MSHASPFRAPHDVTQPFNSGVVKIYSVSDKAEPGYQPDISLSLKYKLNFEEQLLGINRIYLSRQYMNEIKRLVRVPRLDITSRDIAEIEGVFYKIDTVQNVKAVLPPSLDLALVEYDLPKEAVPL